CSRDSPATGNRFDVW
nr:immunoglobulin heavy chain junction region [Macaca mulatta]MOW99184.1 immunoglobulin heavy chain junction region [Macaca mulatta]MOX00316.1 immunoglobulin heavy chain junction region [Macaca mulatta]MOX00729.1 immunoglobulin heavy chain junction region [Macaca mulatta]MOX00858.1 immunoglobulin heavy chain junction region [Macaca mulatta]